MLREAYRFTFTDEVDPSDIEDLILLAVFAASTIHGEAATPLDARYSLESGGRVCTIAIDASTSVGQRLCAVLVGLLIEELGHDAFHVRRVESDDHFSRAKPAAMNGAT